MKTKLTVNECKLCAKKIKSYFGKSDIGEVVVYKNENGVNVCHFLEYQIIESESRFFDFIFSIDGLSAKGKTAEDISYDIYARNHRSEEEEDMLKEQWFKATFKVMTFAEASEKWGLSDSTLRKLVTTDKVKEDYDYRKSGKVWLINERTMKRIYGEPKIK